jgi:hypothetical protein
VLTCQGSPSPHVVLPAAEPTVARAAKPEAGAADACAAIFAEQQNVLDRAIATSKADDPDGWKQRAKLPPENGATLDAIAVACYPFDTRTWALEMKEIQVPALGRSFYAKLVIAAHASGERATFGEIESGFGEVSSIASDGTDYDRDGVPEMIVMRHTMGPEGGDGYESWIVTMHGSKITEYAPAHGITLIGPPVDFDRDGRLDLVTSYGLSVSTEETCEYYKSYPTTPSLLAHALPDGSFSPTDAVAKAYARKTCPQQPAVIRSPLDALCAKLWSATPAEVAASRKRVTACVQWDCELERKHQPQPTGALHDCDPRRETFDQNVPFTLP